MLFLNNSINQSAMAHGSVTDVSKSVSNKKVNGTKRILLITLAGIAGFFAVFAAFCNTESFTKIRMAWRLKLLDCDYAEIVQPFALPLYKDDGFALEVAHLREKTMNTQTEVFFPYFVVKNHGRWEVSGFGRKGIYPYLPSSDSNLYTGGNYISRMGEYTVICVSVRQENSEAFQNISDNFGTEVIRLSAQSDGDTENTRWEFFHITEGGKIYPARARLVNTVFYIFIIKNLPESYELYIGDQKLTAEDIEAQLNAYPKRIIPFTTGNAG